MKQQYLVTKGNNNLFGTLLKYKYLYLMALPGLVFLFIFCYLPMFGVVIAFKDYYPWEGFIDSKWVGIKHFINFFHNAVFWKVLRNTLVIALYKLLAGFPAPIILALLINELKDGFLKRTAQTLSYLPHFISWMIIAGMSYTLFGTDLGILNQILVALGAEPISWYFRPDLWRGIIVITAVWKNVGWGSIIYLASISNIDQSLYEAAHIDGAGKLKRILHITIPSILPVAVILFILNVGNLVREDFQQIFALVGLNSVLYQTTDVIETYIFRSSMLQGLDFSYPAAIGLFQSMIALFMVLGANYLARKRGHEGVF